MSTAGIRKIVSREEAARLCGQWRTEGKRIGFTSGVFDLLHAGHADYLSRARERCDVLLVAVNSDLSVRQNKGPLRPICTQEERLALIAALESVSGVFRFDETNNNINIELLKPDIYFKAGDYSKETLSSAPIVERYGGRVEVLPFVEGQSSTSLIERVLEKHSPSLAEHVDLGLPPARPAVFLDRDGTINEHVDFLHEPEKFRLIPGVMDGLKQLSAAGFRLVVVTNQPGIGLGYFTKEDFFKVNRVFLRECAKAGVMIDKVYFCPHSEAEKCKCRKPFTVLAERAVRDLNLDLSRSFVVGDTSIDLMFASNLGVRSVLVGTGLAGKDGRFDIEADKRLASLGEAAEWIIKQVGKIYGRPDGEQPAAAIGREGLEAIGRATGKIGHDFGNFLGAVQGCLDLIRHKCGSVDAAQKVLEPELSLAQSSIKQAVEFACRIRGYARPGDMPLQQLSLVECVEQVVSLFKDAGMELLMDVEARPMVKANEFALNQVLVSLCANSAEALSGQSDRVLVVYIWEAKLQRAKSSFDLAPGDYAIVSVMDHGRGIKRQHVSRVFEPFFSTKPDTPGKGMGLSLAMAKEVLKRQGGTIAIDSREGVGTIAHLYLPLLGETVQKDS